MLLFDILLFGVRVFYFWLVLASVLVYALIFLGPIHTKCNELITLTQPPCPYKPIKLEIR